eukprot:TRINITY_DN16291_c0_g1_i1.p1 TRINITY_DN16291_c0_g1~~TRINITY_DN16291_c0_g1_i1.p1  ORF type:complete len:505 (+),score=73.91 TRINITY_DN16291_c0_g1_i1:47-1516(+)
MGLKRKRPAGSKTVKKPLPSVRKAAQSSGGASIGGIPLTACGDTASWERLRHRLRRRVTKGQWPGLAASVFVDGKLRMVEEVGYADIQAKAPMTRHSLVRIYSMSKCVVAAAIMQLVEEGQLGLDDKLCDHIPAFKNPRVVLERPDGMPDFERTVPSKTPILIRHLLTHTSGISCGLAPTMDGPKSRSARERAWAGIYAPLVERIDRNEVRDLADWVQELALLPLSSHPGQHYGYGYSYDVLGHLVELKTGQKLQQRLRSRIFGPLGMRDTSFDLRSGSDARAQRLSVLYRYTKSARWGSDGRRYRLVRVDPVKRGGKSYWAGPCRVPSAGGGLSSLEGGLLSTLDDYAKFLLAVTFGGKHPTSGVQIMSKKSAEMMLADQTGLLRQPGSSRGPPRSARPYNDRGLGLSCIGELQRKGAPSWGRWFDGVPEVRLWGGAASSAFKYDPNNGCPLLALVMTQTFPQDDGDTITSLLQGVREVIRAEESEKS